MLPAQLRQFALAFAILAGSLASTGVAQADPFTRDPFIKAIPIDQTPTTDHLIGIHGGSVLGMPFGGGDQTLYGTFELGAEYLYSSDAPLDAGLYVGAQLDYAGDDKSGSARLSTGFGIGSSKAFVSLGFNIGVRFSAAKPGLSAGGELAARFSLDQHHEGLTTMPFLSIEATPIGLERYGHRVLLGLRIGYYSPL